jgi:capsular polysaccharide biosynthesis protein
MLKLALNVIYRWYWLIILVTVLTAVISFLLLRNEPTMYRSSAMLLVGPSTSSPNPELDDLRTSGQLLETYAALATTRPTLEGIITELGLDISPTDLQENIEINTTAETQLMSVRVLDENPDRAVTIVNAITDRILRLSPTSPEQTADTDPYRTLVLEQIDRLEERISNSELLIGQLQENLTTATTRDERIAVLNNILQERGRLSTTEQFLVQLYDTLQQPATNRIEVVEPAIEAREIDSQLGVRTLVSAIAGFILGLVLSIGLEYFNDTVTSADDLPRPAEGITLGTLYKSPRSNSSISVGKGQVKFDPRQLDRYRHLAAKLPALWGGDGAIRGMQSGKAILVTGTPDTDELAEVTAYLGAALAQMGMRVLVVDANYGATRVSRLFKIGDKAGFSDATVNGASVSPIVIDGANGLSILPAGAKPASSFALLASESAGTLLETLQNNADIVLIAAPDLSSADTVLLGAKADAAIVVATGGRSNRAAVQSGIQSIPVPVGLVYIDHATGLRRFLERKASA